MSASLQSRHPRSHGRGGDAERPRVTSRLSPVSSSGPLVPIATVSRRPTLHRSAGGPGPSSGRSRPSAWPGIHPSVGACPGRATGVRRHPSDRPCAGHPSVVVVRPVRRPPSRSGSRPLPPRRSAAVGARPFDRPFGRRPEPVPSRPPGCERPTRLPVVTHGSTWSWFPDPRPRSPFVFLGRRHRLAAVASGFVPSPGSRHVVPGERTLRRSRGIVKRLRGNPHVVHGNPARSPDCDA